ncbi:MAG: DUF58 domain-containing protein [Chloroflexi bacterium]|nr:DUF58 domain-containing protein [Chloroflexota bacterium]
MFGETWLPLAIGLLVLGSVSGQPVLTALGVLLFCAGAVARLWSRWALFRVEYQRDLAEHRAFLGESVALSMRLTNRKFLPLHWILVREEIPHDLRVPEATIEPAPAPGRVYLSRATSLAWYERVGWRYRLVCRQRGYYRIGPTRVRSGDLFGFFPVEFQEPAVEYLLVYPRTVEMAEPDLPFKRPYGDVRSRERLFEDPSRVMGLRDYRPEDPMKHIDWKATARRGSLQVRQFEPTITLHLVIILNINTLPHSWEGHIPELLDEAITTAASLARHATAARWAVGLFANGSFPQSDLPIRLLPSRDARQLLHVLEALAVISPMATAAIEDLVREERHTLPLGATIALVTALATEALWLALASLRADGHRVALVWVGDQPPPACPVAGVSIHRARDFLQL